MKRIEIRDQALLAIVETHLGWGTDNALDMTDEVANAVKLALEAAYEAGQRAPVSSKTGKWRQGVPYGPTPADEGIAAVKADDAAREQYEADTDRLGNYE